MKHTIIADSCCDLQKHDIEADGIQYFSVPLSIILDHKTLTDDDTLICDTLLQEMDHTQHCSTSCPAPESFADLFRQFNDSFTVTLSSALSGTYNSAMLAKSMVESDNPNKRIHIIDSLSASAGEALLVLKIKEFLAEAGASFESVVDKIEAFRDNMSTLFVLKKFDNLVRSGRMSKLTGVVAHALSINPICGDNGHGEIKVIEKVRGQRKALSHLLALIGDKINPTVKSMVISHCDNLPDANWLKEQVQSLYHIKDITIFQTKGISTLYADRHGIVVAF